VNFPRSSAAGTQESSYDLRLDGGAAAGGYDQNYQQGGDYGQQGEYTEVVAEPSEVTLARGQTSRVTCRVKGAQNPTITWLTYAHDTSLPNFARQEGNDLVIAPTADTADQQMYLQCQVNVPGQTQAYHAYVPVNVQGGDQSSKKKKKRRS